MAHDPQASLTRLRSHWFQPRISLAALLALVTLCSIGSWYWWRLPFVVEHTGLEIRTGQEYRIVRGEPIEDEVVPSDPFGPPAGAKAYRMPIAKRKRTQAGSDVARLKRTSQTVVRELETVRRLWDGKTIRQGPLIAFDDAGRKIGESHYREGQLHGLSTTRFSDGHVREQGVYRNGRKDGAWVTFHQSAEYNPPMIRYSKAVSSWKDGVPDGAWDWSDTDGKELMKAEFSSGGLMGALSQSADPGLRRRLAEGQIGNREILLKLLTPVNVEFIETPLAEALDYFARQCEISIVLDYRRVKHAGTQVETPVTLKAPAGTPLIMALGSMLSPLELVGDYRYGVIYITTLASFADGDLTGIARIEPSPESLAQVWDTAVCVEFIETPLPDARAYLERQTGGRLHTDTTRLSERLRTCPVTQNLHDLPLRNVLGSLLDGINCRCRLEGETLVLEEQPTAPAHEGE
jgi:hypothetical protein